MSARLLAGTHNGSHARVRRDLGQDLVKLATLLRAVNITDRVMRL
jgi:hypothetical protein